MKTAVLYHGNLRTFFMPLRENPRIRVCDLFIEQFIKKNDVDCFIITDTNDFFIDGTQFFNKDFEILNKEKNRFSANVKFEEGHTCIKKIEEELQKLKINIVKTKISNKIFNPTEHPNYLKIKNSGYGGSVPESLINQYKKLKDGIELIKKHENENNFKYDNIFKVRFDCIFNFFKDFRINNFSFNSVIVPDNDSGIIFDWYAFGKREQMIDYCSLYDNLGFTINYPSYILKCSNCGHKLRYGEIPKNIKEDKRFPNLNFCCQCNHNGEVLYHDTTIASEYHVSETFISKKISTIMSIKLGFVGFPYRYQ